MAKAVAAEGFKRVGPARHPLRDGGPFYPTVLGQHGIEVVVPTPRDRAYIRERYFAELVDGQFLDETRAGVLAVVADLRETEGVQAVILGGTELPLLLRNANAAVPMLDTTSIEPPQQWLRRNRL